MNYIEDLARVIHREVHGDSSVDADERVLYLIYAVLALSVGTRVTRSDVHDAWSAWMSTQDPGHRSLKPFKDLEPAVQSDDDPYVEAIRRVAGQLEKTA